MATKLLCAFALFLIFSGATQAQQCYNRVYNAPYVVKKEVIVKEIITPVAVPVALPVIIPAYSFQYSPPCAAAAPVAAFGAGGYPMAGQAPVSYNQPVQQPLQQPLQQQQVQSTSFGSQENKIKELAKALLEEMNHQADSNSGPPPLNDPSVSQSPPPVAAPPQLPPQQTQLPPQQNNGQPNPQSKYAQLAINAFSKNCASCHTGTGSRGDAQIFSQPGVLNPNAPFRSMLKEIQTNHMPPKQSQWHNTPEESQIMQLWLSGQ